MGAIGADAITPASGLQAWAPKMVQELGRPGFHATVLQALRDCVGADHISHLSYDGNGDILHSAASSLDDQSMIDWTTDLFVTRLYRRDPHYPLIKASGGDAEPRGVHIVSTVRGAITDPEYRRLLFDKPGFDSKISLIGTHRGSTCYVNVYFSRTRPAPQALQSAFGAHGALLMALAHRHDELLRTPAGPPPDTHPFASLSLRERQVAVLLHGGATAKEIGRQLGLSPATVLTYKARLFDKLGVASLKEFLRRASGAV